VATQHACFARRILAIIALAVVVALVPMPSTQSALGNGQAKSAARVPAMARPVVADPTAPRPDTSTIEYIDEGLCTASCGHSSPDSVEVWSGTTFLQAFATTMDQNFVAYEANTLGYSKKYRCLVGADEGGNSTGSITSYALAPDGTISAEVSNVPDPAAGNPVGVKVNAAGTLVILGDLSNYLSSWKISSGCALSFIGKATNPTGATYSTAGFVGKKQLTAVNSSNNTIDTYTVNSRGALAYQASTPAQFAGADGIASSNNEVVTGNICETQSQVELGTVGSTGAITYLPGSPATDGDGASCGLTTYITGKTTLLEGNYGNSTIGNYSTSPSLAWVSDVDTAGSYAVDDLTPLGKVLFVNGDANGQIVTCRLSHGFVTTCSTYLTLTDGGGYSNGLIVI